MNGRGLTFFHMVEMFLIFRWGFLYSCFGWLAASSSSGVCLFVLSLRCVSIFFCSLGIFEACDTIGVIVVIACCWPVVCVILCLPCSYCPLAVDVVASLFVDQHELLLLTAVVITHFVV